ncbi:MAG: hypothetical protein ACRCXY_00420 [Fusobacteriaceae bacterium]
MKKMFIENNILKEKSGYFTVFFLEENESNEYLRIDYDDFHERDEEQYIQYYLDGDYALEYWKEDDIGIIKSIYNESSYEIIQFNIIDNSVISLEIYEDGTDELLSRRVVEDSGYNTLVINPAFNEYCSEDFRFIKNGIRTLYSKNGVLLEEENYNNGILIGEAKYFYDSGLLKTEKFFRDKEIVKEYYESGQLEFLEIENERVEYYESGKMQRKLYRFKNFIKVIVYYENGNIMEVGTVNYNDEYIGLGWTFYNDGTLKKVCSYLNNEIDGEYKDYYENAQLKTHSYYIQGKESGEFKSYYENGQLECIIDFENGNRSGRYISYFEDGKIESDCQYRENLPFGEVLIYFNNGNLAVKLNHKNGLRVGIAQWYYESGKIKEIINYEIKDNQCYSTYNKIYYESGVLKSFSQWEEAICKYNEKDYSIENILGYLILRISYYDNKREAIRRKEKLIENNIYDLEKFSEDGILEEKGRYYSDKKRSYWIDTYYEYNIEKNEELIFYYDKAGIYLKKEIRKDNNIIEEEIYNNTEKCYEFKSFYKNGVIHREGKYKEEDGQRYWVGFFSTYDENKNLISSQTYDSEGTLIEDFNLENTKYN